MLMNCFNRVLLRYDIPMVNKKFNCVRLVYKSFIHLFYSSIYLSLIFLRFIFGSFTQLDWIMLKHRLWSRLSPQPPLPLRSFVFLIKLETVSAKDLGYICPALRAIRNTCCTFDITWFDSQFFFLWCTPLKERNKEKKNNKVTLMKMIFGVWAYKRYSTLVGNIFLTFIELT